MWGALLYVILAVFAVVMALWSVRAFRSIRGTWRQGQAVVAQRRRDRGAPS